jgi:pyrroline-5-carboxylate reductase
MENSIGFIGGGRITRIMLQAFGNRGLDLKNVAVAEIDQNIARQLSVDYPEISIAEPGLAAAKRVVFIALHPPVIMEMLAKIKPSISSDSIIISLAPKITIEKIAAGVVKTRKVLRLIPNATSYINEGYNPVSFGPGFSDVEKAGILQLLTTMGNTFEVDEQKLEAYAILSAMAPTYFWFQWETLVAIGERIGLGRKESSHAVFNTLQAALNTQFRSGLTPEGVQDLIPVKPICDHESEITQILQEKLLGLHQKIKP